MFSRYTLRTIDLAAARRFYADAMGLDLPEGTAETGVLEAWPLHERAIANGAPAHWLGHPTVPRVEDRAEAMESLGSQRLGPQSTGQMAPDTPHSATPQGPSSPFGTHLRSRPPALSAGGN